MFPAFVALLLCFCGAVDGHHVPKASRFEFQDRQFLLNGKPFRYISGSIHYFRIPPELWNDRLQRIRAAGLNAVQFYVPWNFHEERPGVFNFKGDRNVSRFIEFAQQNDLYVLLRVGPYSCGEWENGGLPWWLLKDKDIRMRTNDSRFLEATDRFFTGLFPQIEPHLLRNGGPILMVQIENEYGSFEACDRTYMRWLQQRTAKGLGHDVLLYTTDGPDRRMLRCGSIAGAIPTVDFGVCTKESMDRYFYLQNFFYSGVPRVNSEFYPGWFVMWGQQKNEVPGIESIMNSTRDMYNVGASFNYYMMHGGTNFAFWNGAEVGSPVITSYDYSSPITEAGDITPNYVAIRDWISTIPDWPNKPLELPKNNTKKAYGKVKVTKLGSISKVKSFASNSCRNSKYPMSFEELDAPYGFVLYETKLKMGGTVLQADALKDHGFVMLDGEYMGTLVNIFGTFKRHSINLAKDAEPGMTLSILVENRGRQTYETINDFKGIISNVTLNGQVLEEWQQCAIQMDDSIFDRLKMLTEDRTSAKGPNVYIGTFEADEQEDTFFDPRQWRKGQLFINGYNVGRYWPAAGPQVSDSELNQSHNEPSSDYLVCPEAISPAGELRRYPRTSGDGHLPTADPNIIKSDRLYKIYENKFKGFRDDY
uniref:Beta-galactosidase n=1 Tax=Steinernema glaseri TaxID=37863 RepID=A0A1I8AE91_9BILA